MFEKKLYVPAKHKDHLQAVIDDYAEVQPADTEQLKDLAAQIDKEDVDQVDVLFDILVEHMGMPDNGYARYEFKERYSDDTPQENWFSGIGGTGWKLWFNSMDLSFRIAHESGMVVRPENVNAANAALKERIWLFLMN